MSFPFELPKLGIGHRQPVKWQQSRSHFTAMLHLEIFGDLAADVEQAVVAECELLIHLCRGLPFACSLYGWVLC